MSLFDFGLLFEYRKKKSVESDRHQGSVRLASQATTGKLAAAERPFKTLWDRKGSWVVGYRRRWLYML